MNTYRFYEQGGTHVLGTFDNDTLLGERTFNTKRLEAVEYQGKIDVKDKVTEKYILKEQVYTNILKEDGTTWGDNVTNSVTALNIFLNSIPYNIADLQDIPYPKVNNGYLKFQDGEYDWGALSIPSPPPENTDFLDEGVTNLYFTEERARDSVSATGSLNYDSETGVFSYTQGDTDTVSEGITNLYYTNDRVDERINLAIGDLTAFLNRYNAEAAANKLLASTDTVIVEKYLTVQADGHGESITAQSDTPSSGNKIVRKIWYKANSFEQSDVDTWTLVHTFADDTAYSATEATFEALLNAQTYGTPPFTLAQSWEDVPAFAGLLDTYPGAAAAYSLRLLDSTYTGDAIRVRRASDNAEQDIGFSNGVLDTSTLSTFCSGTNGFVKVWYDQSSNANDATQTTTAKQPKIYDASTGVATDPDNGKPAIKVANQYLDVNLGAVGTGMYMSVVNEGSSQYSTHIWDVPVMYFNNSAIRIYGGSNFITSNTGLATDSIGLTTVKFDTTTAVARFNGTQVLTGDAGTTFPVVALMARASGIQLTPDAYFQEMIKWANWDTANTSDMENAVANYYNITI